MPSRFPSRRVPLFWAAAAVLAAAAGSYRAEAAAVEMRFRPPLDQPIRYKLSETRRGQVTSIIQSVRYQRLNGGYTIIFTPESVTGVDGVTRTAQQARALLPPELAATFQPMVIEARADAEPRLRDPQTFRRAAAAALTGLRPLAASAAPGDTAMQQLVQLFQRMGDEQLTAAALGEWSPLVDIQEGAFELGSGQPFETSGELLGLGVEVAQRGTLDVQRIGNELTIASDLRSDPRDVAAAIAALSPGASGAQQVSASLQGATIRETSTIRYDLLTGLIERTETVRTVAGGAAAAERRTVIERLR